jgi:nitroreductase
MLKDTSVGPSLPQDQGFAAQSMLLGATEKGLGGCFLVNIKQQQLAEVLHLDEKYEIVAVIAIGYPKEQIVLDAMDASGDVKYWRDEHQIHHVPKRSLEEIIL